MCKLCRGDRRRNKKGHPEPLVRCAKCQADGNNQYNKKKCEKGLIAVNVLGHLTCWDLDIGMMSQVTAYGWECNGK